MSITRRDSRFLGVVLLCQIITVPAFSATTNWFQVTKELKIGSSEQVVRETLDQYQQESWQVFSNSFSQFAKCLVGERVAVWVVDADQNRPSSSKEPFYLIAVFSDGKRLSDLLRFSLPIGFTPLVEGIYSRRLQSIDVGMSVDDLYRLLGVKFPTRYYRDESGRWLVEFSYSESLSSTVDYQADAATGVITWKWSVM